MLRCPRDISPYCEVILNLALEYVSYDHNFTDSMEEDTDEEGQEEEEDEYVTSMLNCLQNYLIDILARDHVINAFSTCLPQ